MSAGGTQPSGPTKPTQLPPAPKKSKISVRSGAADRRQHRQAARPAETGMSRRPDWSRPCRFEARWALPSCFDVGDCSRHQFVHDVADLTIGLRHAFGVEILADLARHVAGGVFEIGRHQRERVTFGFGALQSEFFRSPQAKKLVAT